METATQVQITVGQKAYISRYSYNSSGYYIACNVTKIGKATVTVTPSEGNVDRTFNLPKSFDYATGGLKVTGVKLNDYLEERGMRNNYRPSDMLTFNVEEVEKRMESQAATRERQRKADEIQTAIEKAIKGQYNGMGRYCGGAAHLAKMQAALDCLTKE
jgi:hypothetical protein